MPEFQNQFSTTPSSSAPAVGFEAITPNNEANLPSFPTRAIYVGTGGNLAVVGYPGTTAITFVNVASGTVLPIVATRVNSTNTTATNLVALY